MNMHAKQRVRRGVLAVTISVGLALGLGGCAHHTSAPVSVRPASVSTVFSGMHKVHFEGKGAAAGMMMTSSIGAMGMAVGVAIDEGISKEIMDNAVKANIDFEASLAGRIQNRVKQAVSDGRLRGEPAWMVDIARYGFVFKGLGSERVLADIRLVLKKADGSVAVKFSYPNDVVGDKALKSLPWLAFDSVKTEPKYAEQVLLASADIVVEKLVAQWEQRQNVVTERR